MEWLRRLFGGASGPARWQEPPPARPLSAPAVASRPQMDAEFFRARLSALESHMEERQRAVGKKLKCVGELHPTTLDDAVSFLVDRTKGSFEWKAVHPDDDASILWVWRSNGPNYESWSFYRCGPDKYLRGVYYELD